MVQLLLDNPLLLLFIVAALGYVIGRIKIGGSSLGVAAVLFVGLAFGSLHPDMRLPELFYQFGLIIFVYTIGISSGPGFFAAFRRKGLRDNLLVLGMVLFAAGATALLASLLGLRPTVAVGVFAGSVTNTPALASVLEHLTATVPAALRDQILAEPVVGYSVAYPMGVIGVILAIAITQRIWHVDYAAEARAIRAPGASNAALQNTTIRVTREDAPRTTIRELIQENGWDVLFGRVLHNRQLALANAQTRLRPGDLVSVIGSRDDVERVTAYLGSPSDERLEFDRHELDYRRIFVSNPAIAGHRLRDLNLPQQFGATVTRVRRGDVDLLPHGDTVLELGDRVRVVAPPQHMQAVTRFFGDSYRSLSEVDILTLSLGLALGILIGLIPIPLPGGLELRLGFAGGPLLVALVLGALGRSGPLVWSLPYSANLTLRQLGLVLFLAGVGTRSGYAFVNTFSQGGGLAIFAAGALITCTTALLALWIGYHLLRIPMSLLIGMVAGLHTQPAVLGFSLEQTKNDLPNIGYATVFPIATISKIIIIQVLLIVLQTG